MSLEGREEPENQTEIDRRFAEIVAQFGADEADWDTPENTTDGGREHPVAEAEPGDNDDDVDDDTPAAPLAELPAQWRMPPSGSASLLDDEDETFVPAPPRPLPSSEEDIGF